MKKTGFLNIKQAAEFLNLPEWRIRQLIIAGKIKRVICDYKRKYLTTPEYCNEYYNNTTSFEQCLNQRPPNKLKW